MATSERSTPPTLTQLTLFAEGFPANLTPLLANVEARQTTATSGQSFCESFAALNRDGSWRKTSQGYSQVTLDGFLEEYSETWPRAGMTRSGTAYRLPPLAPLTDATECGLWRTPSATEANGGGVPGDRQLAGGHSMRLRDQIKAPSLWPTPRASEASKNPNDKNRESPCLSWVVRNMWPTPTTQDASNNAGSSQYDRNSLPLNAAVGGALNPTWVEWLMGYPLGWTVCEDWGMRSSRRSLNGSRVASSPSTT